VSVPVPVPSSTRDKRVLERCFRKQVVDQMAADKATATENQNTGAFLAHCLYSDRKLGDLLIFDGSGY
jgi:hypothetical protein